MTILKYVREIFLFIFIFFSFYFRVPFLSISTLMIALILFLFQIYNKSIFNIKLFRLNFVYLDPLYSIFIVLLFISLIYNLFMYINYFKYTIRFFIEIFLNLVVLFLMYIIIFKDFRFFNRITNYIVFSTYLYPVPAIIGMAVILTDVRRIGAADAEVITAVNHMGHSLAIAASVAFSKLVFEEKRIYLVFFLSILVACFLTGSRAAILAVILNILLIIHFKNNKVFNIYVIFILSVTITCFFIFNSGKFTGLLHRLSINMIELAIKNRMTSFSDALINFHVEKDIFFGAGFYKYELLNATNESISYPHNIIIEILTMFGLLPALVFLSILGKEWSFLFSRIFNRKVILKYEVVIAMCFLNSVIIYSFTSGRLTRIITIFFVLGMCSALRKKIRFIEKG